MPKHITKLFLFSLAFLMLPSFVLAEGKLLQESDLIYEGAFRVPRENLGGDSTYPQTLARGGVGLTYNSNNNSLIMISRGSEKLAVEISIPTSKIDGNIANLNTAVLMQVPGNVANSQWDNLKIDGTAVGNGGSPGGLLVYNNKLIGSAYAYYDGNSEAARSHFTASLNWTTTGSQFSGMYRVGIHPTSPVGANGGFVGGYMAHVPPEWQSSFGFPVLTGKGAIAVITRSSLGPSAWGFNPDSLGTQDPVNATFMVGYPSGHETLGTYSSTPSLYYNMATQLNGLVFPQGSDSVLFFGRHGLGLTGEGDTCYGTGTDNINLVGTQDSFGNDYCYDPVNSGKGEHGYPYINQVWAYDAQELVDVKNGLKNPWDIIPYARWEFELPFAFGMKIINGVAYDPATQRIFIAQHESDSISNPYEPYPIIHVFSINIDSDIIAPTAPSGLSVL